MSENNNTANRILHEVSSTVTPKVKANAKCVQEFLEKLHDIISEPKTGTSFNASIIHGGSSYEGLAVKEKVDFDITLMLGEPFVSENFSVGRDPSNFFTLKWKSHLPVNRYVDREGFLEATKMREAFFEELKKCTEKVYIPNAKVTCRNGLAALDVVIQYETGLKISIDLVPQIPFRSWGQCPDLLPMDKLPVSLRQYIDTLNRNKSPCMFFSLGVPGASNYRNPDQLFNISFSLLEKEFLKSNTEIRNMVRIVKYIADRRGWKKNFSFKSFHAKRVAIKYHHGLKGNDLWNGCVLLLKYLSHELRSGTIDGYFVKNQVMHKWEAQEIVKFQEEIRRVVEMNLKDL